MAQNSYVVDNMTVGTGWPVYTWRKGGLGENDDHLYLMIGSAYDEVVKGGLEGNVLIEVDPTNKVTSFWNEAKLLSGFSFEDNTLGGTSLKDGTVQASKLAPNIVIDGSISRLTTARSIDGLKFDGSTAVTRFAVCSTKAEADAKVASCAQYELTTGSCVYVVFVNNNTSLAPTLNINDTGAKPIYYHGKRVVGTDLVSGHVYCVVYDGAKYVVMNDATHFSASMIQYGAFFNAGSENIWKSTLVMKDATGKHYSIVKSQTTADSKVPTKQWLDPSKVYFHKGHSNVSNNQTSTEQNIVYLSGPFDLQYSFNVPVAKRPTVGTKIYIKVLYDKKKKLVQLADQWLATSIPYSNDGYSYLYIGEACGDAANAVTTQCTLSYTNELYVWKSSKYEPLGDSSSTVSLTNENFLRGNVDVDLVSNTQLAIFDSKGPEENVIGILGYLDQAVKVSAGGVDNTLKLTVKNALDAEDDSVAEMGISYKALSDGSIQKYTFAPTPDANDNSNQIATTEWVRNYVSSNFVTIEQAQATFLTKQQYQSDIDEAYKRLS